MTCKHEWQDTGFADLDECPRCGAMRSSATGEVVQGKPVDEVIAEARRRMRCLLPEHETTNKAADVIRFTVTRDSETDRKP